MYFFGSLTRHDLTLWATCFQLSCVWSLLERIPATTTIARGNPSHFLAICFPISINDGGQLSSWNTFCCKRSQLSSAVRKRRKWGGTSGLTGTANSLSHQWLWDIYYLLSVYKALHITFARSFLAADLWVGERNSKCQAASLFFDMFEIQWSMHEYRSDK